jgi:hypothetical protein
MLMRAAESALVDAGARVLVVTAGNHRADAHAFYEELWLQPLRASVQEVAHDVGLTSRCSRWAAGDLWG